MNNTKTIAIILISMVVLSCRSTKNDSFTCDNFELYYTLVPPFNYPISLVMNHNNSVYFMSDQSTDGYDIGVFKTVGDSVIFYPSVDITSIKYASYDTVYTKKYISTMIRKENKLIERDEWRIAFGPDTMVLRAYMDFNKSNCDLSIFR